MNISKRDRDTIQTLTLQMVDNMVITERSKLLAKAILEDVKPIIKEYNVYDAKLREIDKLGKKKILEMWDSITPMVQESNKFMSEKERSIKDKYGHKYGYVDELKEKSAEYVLNKAVNDSYCSTIFYFQALKAISEAIIWG